MESFSITCTTCQKRLRVRDAAVVGQILICPNCSSMVLVEPPAEPVKPPVSAAELPSAAAAGPAGTEPLAEGPPRVSQSRDDVETEELFEAAAPPVEEYFSDSPSAPLLPDESWSPPAVEQRRQWLLLGFAAVVGAGLAVGMLGLLAVGASGRSGAAPNGSAETPALETAQVSEDPPRTAEPTADPPAVSETPNVGGDSPPSDSVPPAAAETPEDIDARKPAAVPPSAESPDDVRLPAPAPPPVAEADEPLEPPADTPDTSALVQALDAFAPYLDEPPYMPPNETPVPDPAQMDPADVTNHETTVARPSPRAVDVDARLQDMIPHIEFSGVPLISFLRFMTGFSTIPITLDPDALALLRIKPQMSVHVQMSDARVGEVLTAALEPLRLDYVRVGEQLVVTRPASAPGQFRRYRHPVGDLVGSDERQLAELAEWIVTLIEPDSWESLGGLGLLASEMPVLEIQNEDTVLFRALLFCERLRVARGLPTITNLDPELFHLEPRATRARQALDRPLRTGYQEPTLMVQILDRITQETGLQILVDWRALGELGWTPEAETTLSADGQPVGDALSGMLRRMDLTYRVLDASTVQITSPEALQRQWDVEFYPVSDLIADAPGEPLLLVRLRAALQAEGLAESGYVVYLDAASGHLIAALPQPRQNWLAQWLQGRRQKGT